ncbi:MAG: NAD-dependent epimerase/dehydratase family protein, partial [candidate division WOR-3 bacterium]
MTTYLSGKHVLVTGGAGFIGCNLVRRLLKEGAYVRVFDNFSTGKRENLADLQGDYVNAARSASARSHEASLNRSTGAVPSRRLEVFEGDLRDFALILEATKGIEIVFHEAALPSVIRSVKAPNTTNDVNITGTLNLLEACKVNKVRRVIYASSSSIYGDSDELP